MSYQKIKKVLIANRAEIALRIKKSCDQLGLGAVAVFSDADRDARYLDFFESYYIGESASEKSYLNIDKLIQVAKESSCNAIHPGYGFLSENHLFAIACKQAKILFLGPHPDSIKIMSDKEDSKLVANSVNVPVIPSVEINQKELDKSLYSKIQEMGYPILIKAANGGGGKGMRVVHQESDFHSLYQQAIRESEKSFASSKILVEKYFTSVKHIEIQIIADHKKNVVVLGDRDCSLQRRYQKVIEEAPSSLPLSEKENYMIMQEKLLKK